MRRHAPEGGKLPDAGGHGSPFALAIGKQGEPDAVRGGGIAGPRRFLRRSHAGKASSEGVAAASHGSLPATFRKGAMSHISAQLREAVVERAGNRCEYCHLSQDSQVVTFPVDHVTPVFLTGLTELANLALACPRCNARKWKHVKAPDADTGQMVVLYNPRGDRWSDHFR